MEIGLRPEHSQTGSQLPLFSDLETKCVFYHLNFPLFLTEILQKEIDKISKKGTFPQVLSNVFIRPNVA